MTHRSMLPQTTTLPPQGRDTRTVVPVAAAITTITTGTGTTRLRVRTGVSG